jgi:hypothetical protein
MFIIMIIMDSSETGCHASRLLPGNNLAGTTLNPLMDDGYSVTLITGQIVL